MQVLHALWDHELRRELSLKHLPTALVFGNRAESGRHIHRPHATTGSWQICCLGACIGEASIEKPHVLKCGLHFRSFSKC